MTGCSWGTLTRCSTREGHWQEGSTGEGSTGVPPAGGGANGGACPLAPQPGQRLRSGSFLPDACSHAGPFAARKAQVLGPERMGPNCRPPSDSAGPKQHCNLLQE